VFGTVLDSLRNRNVSVSPEKWSSIESESLCEIVWLVCWNVLNSVEIRSESELLETPILPFHGCSTKTQNVSNRFTSETFWFFPIWNRSKWFKLESETFHLAKRPLSLHLWYIGMVKLITKATDLFKEKVTKTHRILSDIDAMMPLIYIRSFSKPCLSRKTNTYRRMKLFSRPNCWQALERREDAKSVSDHLVLPCNSTQNQQQLQFDMILHYYTTNHTQQSVFRLDENPKWTMTSMVKQIVFFGLHY
jgi:hypothetical protein